LDRPAPLSRLLLSPPAADRPLCFWKDQTLDWGGFLGLLGPLSDKVAAAPPGAYLLFAKDSGLFLLGLLALWLNRKTVVLPPNDLPETLAELAPQTVGLVSDFDPPARCLHLDLRQLSSGAVPVPRLLCPGTPALVLVTSGSTGSPKRVEKTLDQLETELLAQESLWGEGTKGARVYATVSHQHIYGLLFRLLWPLVTGRPFARFAHLYPEELALDMVGPSVLVSGPAHLKRFPQLVSLADFGDKVRLCLSSGGPLDRETALSVAQGWGRAPVEIFGSTETGGVAYRCRQEGQPERLWTPLPGVEVRSDQGQLLVRSPYVNLEGQAEWFLMGDLVELRPLGFELLGRADRVAKIEEKRVSLPRMEAKLLERPEVAQAWLTALESPPGRVRLAGVLGLTQAGWEQVDQTGERALTQVLRDHLRQSFEELLVPRRFLLLPQLPLDPQGKPDRSRMTELLLHPRLPQILGRRSKPEELWVRLRVPNHLAYFQGHFDQAPVLPGVVEVFWVHQYLNQALGRLVAVKRVSGLKFSAPLLPGAVCELQILLAGPGRWSFVYTQGSTRCGSGILELER